MSALLNEEFQMNDHIRYHSLWRHILFLPVTLVFAFIMVGQGLAEVRVTNDAPEGKTHETQEPVSTVDRKSVV